MSSLRLRASAAATRVLAPQLAYKPLNPHSHFDYDYEQFSLRVQQALRLGEPLLVGRLGTPETTNCLVLQWEKQAHPLALCVTAPYRKGIRESAKRNAGIFPNDKATLEKFSAIYLQSLLSIDILGSCIHQELFLNRAGYLPFIRTVFMEDMVPFIGDNPWSAALVGKRVLVIHPFARSIESQFSRRELLFPNSEVLPAFDLIAYPAVQSLGGNDKYDSWIDALDRMKQDISEISFDVSIIGCGAYGLPLGAFVKGLGKPAIHLGGVTQCLFGIKGRRWAEDYGWEEQYFNRYWVWPDRDERPAGASAVENGCYWAPDEDD